MQACIHAFWRRAAHVCVCVMAQDALGRGVRYVVSGTRVTEQQARAHAAAGGVVCAVPQLTGGGCGMSVSVILLCRVLCVISIFTCAHFQIDLVYVR